MKPVLRRHPVATFVVAAVVLVAIGVAAAPWWIDLGPVRAKIERAASSGLAGKLTYERMDLSWFPRPEVVVRGLKISMPGTVQGAVRTVRVSPALRPLLRGRVVLTKIGVDGLDLHVDLDAPKDAQPHPAPPGSDWTQALRSMGSQTVDVELSRGRVALSRPTGKSLTFEGIRLEASLRSADGKAAFTLSHLSVDSPRLLVEGSLRADVNAPHLEATAKGTALDVTDVRAKLLAFAGDDAVIASILGILRGGTLTSFSFASSGKAPADLGVLERMSIRAEVENAKVRIPGPSLDLSEVRASVKLEGGVLSAERAEARLGRSRASEGSVVIGLARGDDRLRVDTRVKADLAEVPAVLARVIPSRSFHKEVALVEGLRGSATGRITIGDRSGDLNTDVSVSEMRFSARYGRLPWPIAVNNGRFFLDGKGVGMSGLSGSLGRSTFSGLAARVRLGREAVLERAEGSLEVSLEDFLEGARSIPSAASLVQTVKRGEGSVHIDLRRLAGPLARLGEASLAASGSFEGILFDSSSLPPLSIPSGRFAVGDDAVRVSDADVRTLDASLRVSGTWSGWRGGEQSFEAAAEGSLGPNAIDWGWRKSSLPAEFLPAAPIALRGVRFSRAPGGALTATGDFVVANGPRLTLDLAGDGKKIDVRNLTVADGDSTATMSLFRQEEVFDVAYKGRLAGPTLAKLFRGREWHGGAIEGDLRALIPAENLARLTAEGTLTATNFDVPTPAGSVTLESLHVRAAKNRFDVASSSFVLDEQRFSAAGNATLRDGAIDLDIDVSTGDLAWTSVEKVLARIDDAGKKEPVAAQKKPGPAPPALCGDVRVALESFSHGSLVWKPVLAEVRFGNDGVTAAVRKADVCGVSTTGDVRFLPGGALAVEARVDAAGSDINAPLTCLGFEDARMTGNYEASVRVKGEAPASELPRALRGPVSFEAVKGRIGKATLMTRILGVLNATDVFAGKDKTRVGDAIPFDRITASGEIADGRLSIGEAAFVAPSITMAATGTVGYLDQSLDLMVLSHPLSTLDKIVQAVPLVRRILGRNFLAVAVRVTGTTGDPKVTMTPGRDVGKGLVGILERTVTLPVTVFDPPSQPAR